MTATIVRNELFTQTDIYEARDNRGRLLPLEKAYDPAFFWEDIAETYYRQFTKPEMFQINVAWFIDRLKVLKPASVLEAGCGFGRILPFLLQAGCFKEVHGVDVSKKMLELAQDYLNPVPGVNLKQPKLSEMALDQRLPEEVRAQLKLLADKHEKPAEGPKTELPDFRGQIKLTEGDIRSLPFEDRAFELVMTSEVVQHLNPKDAVLAIRECTRVAGRVVILVERWGFPSEHAEPHIWSHDLGSIIKEIDTAGEYQLAQVCSVNQGVQGVVAIRQGA